MRPALAAATPTMNWLWETMSVISAEDAARSHPILSCGVAPEMNSAWHGSSLRFERSLSHAAR